MSDTTKKTDKSTSPQPKEPPIVTINNGSYLVQVYGDINTFTKNFSFKEMTENGLKISRATNGTPIFTIVNHDSAIIHETEVIAGKDEGEHLTLTVENDSNSRQKTTFLIIPIHNPS